MKNLLWVLIAGAVLIGGYMLVTGKSVEEIGGDVTESGESATEAVTEAAEEAAEEAEESE